MAARSEVLLVESPKFIECIRPLAPGIILRPNGSKLTDRVRIICVVQSGDMVIIGENPALLTTAANAICHKCGNSAVKVATDRYSEKCRCDKMHARFIGVDEISKMSLARIEQMRSYVQKLTNQGRPVSIF